MGMWVPSKIPVYFYPLVFSLVLLTTLVYIRIYLAVRHHKNQIQVLQVQHAPQTGESANFAFLIKSEVDTF